MTFLEGRGSLHSFLRARGWATSLSAGVGDEGMHRSSVAYVFAMSIHLTDSGLEKVCFYFLKIAYCRRITCMNPNVNSSI